MARAAQSTSTLGSLSVGFSLGKYTRAESDHPVIDNRKVFEILQCLLSAGSVDASAWVRPARARLTRYALRASGPLQ